MTAFRSCKHPSIYTYTYIHIHTYIHTYTHIYIHTYPLPPSSSNRQISHVHCHTQQLLILSYLLPSKPLGRQLFCSIHMDSGLEDSSYDTVWAVVVCDFKYTRNLWLYAKNGGSGSHRRPYIRSRLWGIPCQKIVFFSHRCEHHKSRMYNGIVVCHHFCGNHLLCNWSDLNLGQYSYNKTN